MFSFLLKLYIFLSVDLCCCNCCENTVMDSQEREASILSGQYGCLNMNSDWLWDMHITIDSGTCTLLWGSFIGGFSY